MGGLEMIMLMPSEAAAHAPPDHYRTRAAQPGSSTRRLLQLAIALHCIALPPCNRLSRVDVRAAERGLHDVHHRCCHCVGQLAAPEQEDPPPAWRCGMGLSFLLLEETHGQFVGSWICAAPGLVFDRPVGAGFSAGPPAAPRAHYYF